MPPTTGATGYRARVRSSLQASSWAVRAAGVAGFAALTGILAQLEVYAPWNPYVPYTGQILAVMASGLVLGAGPAAASMGLYLLLGATGVPVFADWSGGIAVLKGRTAGYLFGFVAAAWLTGWLSRRYQDGPSLRRLARLGVGGVVASVALFGVGGLLLGFRDAWSTQGLGATVVFSSLFIVGLGCLLWVWSRDETTTFLARLACALIGSVVVYVPGVVVLRAVTELSWPDAFAFGVLQFLPLDLAKAFLAASAAAFVLPPARS